MSIGGRPVDAFEAADAAARGYQCNGHHWHGAAVPDRVIASRMSAGWPDPVGRLDQSTQQQAARAAEYVYAHSWRA